MIEFPEVKGRGIGVKMNKFLGYGLGLALAAALALGTWALVAWSQGPQTASDGSIPIPEDMIKEFKSLTGENPDELNQAYKALSERAKRLEPFFIQLRMNLLQKARVPANQYDNWRLDTEKKALVRVDPKTGQPINK